MGGSESYCVTNHSRVYPRFKKWGTNHDEREEQEAEGAEGGERGE